MSRLERKILSLENQIEYIEGNGGSKRKYNQLCREYNRLLRLFYRGMA